MTPMSRGVRLPGLALRLSPLTPSSTTAGSLAIGRSGGRDRLFGSARSPAPIEILDNATRPSTRSRSAAAASLPWPAAPDAAWSVVQLDLATGARRSCAGRHPTRSTRRTLAGRDDRVPDDGRPHRVRLLLPARQPRLRGPGGELPPLIVTSHGGPTAAASTASTFRTQLFDEPRASRVVDVDYGGSTGYGTRLPEAPRGRVGRRRRRRLRRGGPSPGDRARRRRAVGHPRRQRVRLHDALRAHLPRRLHGRRGTSGSATWRHSQRRPTSSSRATRLADRARGRRREALPRAIAALPTPTDHVPVLVLQGARGQDRPAVRGRADRRRPLGAALPARVSAFEGEDHGFRKPRTSSARSRPSSRSTARSSASSRPIRIEPIEVAFLDEGAAGSPGARRIG